MEYKTKDSKERVKFKSGVEVEIKNDKITKICFLKLSAGLAVF